MEARKAEIANREDSSSVRAFAEQSIFEAERQIVAKNVDKALADRKISALKYIVEMCSDEGIKKMLLAQFMPILNHLIASYLEKFDLPVKVEFDDKFNHTLTAPKGLGQRHPMMSRGQKTRINLAILFAIAELIRKMGSVRCNLMLLDEFADEGLDAKGFEAAVSSIRRIADRDHRSITLITHKQEDVLFENITKLYEVELKNSFTVLKEVSSY
jgi:DNA repair exonuclease SbcCD ATPase subunit